MTRLGAGLAGCQTNRASLGGVWVTAGSRLNQSVCANSFPTTSQHVRLLGISACSPIGSGDFAPTPTRELPAGTIIKSSGVQIDATFTRSKLCISRSKSARKALPGRIRRDPRFHAVYAQYDPRCGDEIVINRRA